MPPHCWPASSVGTVYSDLADKSRAHRTTDTGHRHRAEIKQAIAGLDRRIKEAHPQVKRVFIEAEAMRRGLTRTGSPPAKETSGETGA